ncbi:MAG: hypothetical protein JNJ60_22750, partial [Rhodocyclaceae bacterium]|nr:hypothetical protein [Rhodocyclaceae bacterium]
GSILAAASLVVDAAGGATLTQATNNTGVIAARVTSPNAAFRYVDADALSIGTITPIGSLVPISGVTTNNGLVSVRAPGALAVDQAVSAGTGDIYLAGGAVGLVLNAGVSGNQVLFEGGTVSQTAGTVTANALGLIGNLGSVSSAQFGADPSTIAGFTTWTRSSGPLTVGTVTVDGAHTAAGANGGVLVFNANNGSLSIAAPVTAATSVSLQASGTVNLGADITAPSLDITSTTAGVTQSAGRIGGTGTVHVSAAGNVSLAQSGNDAAIVYGDVSNAGASFVYTDSDALAVGNSGISTQGGLINVEAGAALNVNAPVQANGGNVRLASGATLTLGDNVAGNQVLLEGTPVTQI